jgi:hypothetical protein
MKFAFSETWVKPWRNLAILMNLMLPHMVGVIFLGFLAWLAGDVSRNIFQEELTWSAGKVTVSLSDMLHWFDLVVIVLFFVVAVRDV